MKKQTEHSADKPSIDALFARKLGEASLPPSASSFERLQARMAQQQTKPRVLAWGNPTVQRYMAVAACLALVCLFGWLYLSDNQTGNTNVAAVADKQKAAQETSVPTPVEVVEPATNLAKQEQRTGTREPTVIELPEDNQLAMGDKTIQQTAEKGSKTSLSVPSRNQSLNGSNAAISVSDGPAIAQAKSAEAKANELTTPKESAPESAITTQRVAATQPLPAAERVLVVTIAEPARLVSARQAVKEPGAETAASDAEKMPKDGKQGGFWEQVRRVKQGEVFARRDRGDEERGLISRAYGELKHTINKDKDARE